MRHRRSGASTTSGGGACYSGRFLLWLTRLFARRMYTRMLAPWPKGVRELLIDRHVSPEWLRIGAQERSNLPELGEELQHGGDAPDVPLIVLTALGVDPGQALLLSKKAVRELIDGKRRLYTALAESVPRGEHRMLDDAAHSTVHIDRPDAVLQAIRDLLGRVDS